jgi:hypothetical protein
MTTLLTSTATVLLLIAGIAAALHVLLDAMGD